MLSLGRRTLCSLSLPIRRLNFRFKLLLLFCCSISVAIFYIVKQGLPSSNEAEEEENVSSQFNKYSRDGKRAGQRTSKFAHCSMGSCFNFSRCSPADGLLVHIYPTFGNSSSPAAVLSPLYRKILGIIRQSPFYTDRPDKACLFILAIDSIDRDRISEHFVRNIGSHVGSLPAEVWDEGRNHLIFNLYFGTFPDYSLGDLGFDTGKAILALASFHRKDFRPDFDISLPLFHEKHPLHHAQSVPDWDKIDWPNHDQYLLSFKGKRYVYGIGSETRDLLHHLHNGRSIVVVTTCRHNADWRKFEDGRCAADNAEYDRWDYDGLMANSTFCLVPRGRRLGSFRFLESLGRACIPTVFSDGWILPFSEVIDWAQLAFIGREEAVLFVPSCLSRLPINQILRRRKIIRRIYADYFSSIERIVLTSIQIVLERVKKHMGMAYKKNWMRLDDLDEAGGKCPSSK